MSINVLNLKKGHTDVLEEEEEDLKNPGVEDWKDVVQDLDDDGRRNVALWRQICHKLLLVGNAVMIIRLKNYLLPARKIRSGLLVYNKTKKTPSLLISNSVGRPELCLFRL